MRDGWLIDWKVWLIEGWVDGLIDRVIGNEPFSKEVASRGLSTLSFKVAIKSRK